MILFCGTLSPPCRIVILFMHTLNLTAEMRTVNLAENDQMAPEYLAMNPQHTIPVLIDDRFVLSESRAIIGYLADKYAPGTTYYPNEPMARGVVNQRLMFDMGTLFQPVFETYMNPLQTGGNKKNDLTHYKIIEGLELLETLMGNAPYMAGDKLTIADFSIVVTVSMVDKVGLDLTPYPKIKNWYERCQKEMKDYEEANGKPAEMLGNLMKSVLNL